MATREMKTIGHEAYMVFADGKRVEYPRYRISANGFIRGPRNEQVGRGNNLITNAYDLCRELQQRWFDQFNRFRVGFVGTTVPNELLTVFDRNVRAAKPFSPDGMSVVVKAYWANEPDCYDIIGLGFTKNTWENSASAALTVLHMPLRKLPFEDAPAPYDEFGTITQQYVPIESMITWTRSEKSNLRSAVQRMRDWVDEIETVLTEQYVNFTTTQPFDEIRTAMDEFLAGTSVVAEIQPHLKAIALLFQKIGYAVTDQSTDTLVKFAVRDNEHEVTFSDNALQVTCLYEKDEERLTQLQKMRLQAEYEESLKVHGDLTDVDFTIEP